MQGIAIRVAELKKKVGWGGHLFSCVYMCYFASTFTG